MPAEAETAAPLVTAAVTRIRTLVFGNAANAPCSTSTAPLASVPPTVGVSNAVAFCPLASANEGTSSRMSALLPAPVTRIR